MADKDHTQPRGVRRVRVERSEAMVIAVIAVASGVGAALARMHPTPWGWANTVWSFAVTAAVVWAAATTRWWLLAISAIVAMLISSSVAFAGVAIVAFAIALVIGMGYRRVPIARSASAALSSVVLLRSDLRWFHGASALIVAALAVAIGISGVQRRSRATRRLVKRVVTVVAAVIGLVTVGTALAAFSARSALTDSRNTLRQALAALRGGDFAQATELITASRDGLRRGADAFEKPWSVLAGAVPLLGQQTDAVRRVADAGADMADVAAASVGQVDLDSLTVRNGVIDLDAIAVLEAPLQRTYEALTSMDRAFRHQGDSWLVSPLADRLAPVADEVGDLLDQTKVALDTVAVAPAMLGANGPRTYFVAFTTPAEARGAGGFMATWAELRVNKGSIDVVHVANTRELLFPADARPTLKMPAEYNALWGGFGAGKGVEPVSVDFWSNVTMPPDLPTVSDVIAQLYQAGRNTKIDGVIVLDVQTIARFLKITGPITVPGLDQQLTSDNAAQYLLFDQYERFSNDDERDRVQSEITDQLLSKVFEGSLPGVRVMAEAIGPSIGQRRLQVWSLHAEDQSLLSSIGIDGQLPDTTTVTDGFGVFVNNAAGNKIDAYLRRTVSYDSVLDRDRSRITGVLEVTLENKVTNVAQRSPYAVGNLVGLPPGTNRMFLSVLTRLPITAATMDGAPIAFATRAEKGWIVNSAFVNLDPGQRRVLRIETTGELDTAAAYQFAAIPQPSAQDDTIRVHTTTIGGDSVSRYSGTFDRLVRLTSSR